MPSVLYITASDDPLVAKVLEAASGRLDVQVVSGADLPSLEGFDALLVGDGPLAAPLPSFPENGPKLVQLTRGHHRDVDAAALAVSGVNVAGASPALAEQVAMHALSLAVCATATSGPRGIQSHETVAAFREDWRATFDGTLGIVGFGRVGQAFAKAASNLFGRIIYADVRTAAHDITAGGAIRRSTLDMLLSKSDIVSLHVQWGPTSNPLLGAREIHLMGPDSTLVNTADARLVDNEALVSALDSGQLGSAGLDIEEPQLSQLAGLPGVVATPYTAARSEKTDAAVAAFVVDNIEKTLSGAEPQGLIEIVDYPRAGDPAFWSSRMAPRV